MQKQKMPGSEKEPRGCLGFSIALNIHLIYSVSMLQEHIRMAKVWQLGAILQKQNVLKPYVPQSDTQVQSF